MLNAPSLRDQLTKIGIPIPLINYLSRTFRFLARYSNRYQVIKYRKLKITTPLDIVTNHFEYWSSLDHPNRKAFEIVIGEIDGSAANIVETGTSAWGTDSTRLWDKYVTHYGGSFQSVDIRSEPARSLKGQIGKRSRLVVSDSVDFLKNDLPDEHIDVFYLDSWDVDWFNPLDSAMHGYKEFKAIVHRLKNGSILFVDDTPISQEWLPDEFRESALKFKNDYGVFPGKGALIIRELRGNPNVQFLIHEYSVVIRFP